MSWFRRRACPPVVVPSLGTSIVTAAMRAAAEEYVRDHLQLGEKIHEGTDGPFIASFRQLIPAALARRGLQLVPISGGWRVEQSTFPSLPRLPAECGRCHASIFECGHGCGGVIWEFDWTSAKEQRRG